MALAKIQNCTIIIPPYLDRDIHSPGLPVRHRYKDVLDYNPDADRWKKVGEMAHARGLHGMSLVPKETADYCV